MSLPKHFDDPKDYFEKSVDFFQEYQYLYNFPNTEILVRNILDKIDVTHVDNFDVMNKNIGIKTQNDFLTHYFEELEKLQVDYDDFDEDTMEYNVNAPLSPKKKHEIIYLAREIKEMCENAGCEVVVDFGSGLGYLDQLIFETTNYNVLGIECNESHYVGAKIRQRKYHSNSIDNVKYIKHRVTENSKENINAYLEDKFPDHRQFCITGLHACADLTIDAINLFLKMPDAKALVIMPCCYHKMYENEGIFKNFPLSSCLKDFFEKNKAFDYLRVPFLRLAAQPPTMEEKLEDLVFNLVSRAVLQLYAHRHNCKLKRKKRKAVKTKSMENNFQTYLQDATSHGFTLIKNQPLCGNDKDETSTFDTEELTSLWNELPPLTFKKAAIFIRLQIYLQPVIENFVLYDRIMYMRENGVTNCSFKKILNENTSPRCLALIAKK